MLEVRNLRFVYPTGREVIRDVSFSIPSGKRMAIVGANGSGKTTLARLMSGLLKPTSGTVTVDGLDSRDDDCLYEVRRRVGLVFQDPEDQIVETTVEREIGFGPRNLGLEPEAVQNRVRNAIELFGIQHLKDRPCHLLSAGEKQILTVTSIFAMQPDYVVLDESTSLLDSGARCRLVAAVERLLDETGSGLAFITMRLEDVWICDHVIFLKEGMIDFEGGKKDFLGYLTHRDVPVSGLPLLMREMDEAFPELVAEMSECSNLSAATLSDRLLRLARSIKGDSPCQ